MQWPISLNENKSMGWVARLIFLMFWEGSFNDGFSWDGFSINLVKAIVELRGADYVYSELSICKTHQNHDTQP